ncbi:hypothetical protein GQ44DRAFT_636057 [Phaeosphaeriaceae sp. PMI808]|nr:hypothetical protein GQ44DRAFT_636057 [Phaeosphaeriaceae sp. PMI808]
MGLPNLDLSLPDREPKLLEAIEGATLEEGSFAVYTAVPGITESDLEAICKIPQAEWEDIEMETQLLRPAKPTPFFTNRTLKYILAAHVAMDKEIQEHEDGGASDVGWQPHAFVVVTKPMEELEDHGLLLVYTEAFPDEDEEKGTLDKFFFAPKDMYMLLSGVILGTSALSVYKNDYDIDGETWKRAQEEENAEDGDE